MSEINYFKKYIYYANSCDIDDLSIVR
jgi:hypothetical protein